MWKRIDPIVSHRVTVETTPAGAAVSCRGVGSDSNWIGFGSTPIVNAVVPNAYLEWRFEKAGYVTATDAASFGFGIASVAAVVAVFNLQPTLHTPEQTPPGMVHVTAGDEPRISLNAGLEQLPPQRLHDFCGSIATR